MQIKTLIEQMKHATDEQNLMVEEMAQDMLDSLKRNFPTTYKKYEKQLKEIFPEENYLTKDEAMEYVEHFKNKDGSVGEHWTYEQTTKYLESHEELSHLNPVCFYVAINMMYSDYYKPTRPVEAYAGLAKDFLTDPDAPKDKLKRYLVAMHA